MDPVRQVLDLLDERAVQAAIDPEIVQSIVENHLDDLRELSRIVLRRFGIEAETGP